MKIASSTIQMESSHSAQQVHTSSVSLRAWIGQRQGTATSVQTSTPVQLSDRGKVAQSNDASSIQNSLDAVQNDPMLRLLMALIAQLTGRPAQVFDSRELQASATPAAAPNSTNPTSPAPTAPQAAGYGVEYDAHASFSESEQTRFAASGSVLTSDGKQIDFSVALTMARSYQAESDIHLRAGDARQTQDPLVINFGGTAAQLTSQRFSFDLNADGNNESINFTAAGSGFLAFDRNGDGKINNGTELFGATTGNGFAELAALDSDHNGWIDENDAAYSQLRVWTKDAAGKDQLATLAQADVGALNVASVATPFAIKDGGNALQGQIAATGIYLHAGGDVGTIQHVNLTV